MILRRPIGILLAILVFASGTLHSAAAGGTGTAWLERFAGYRAACIAARGADFVPPPAPEPLPPRPPVPSGPTRTLILDDVVFHIPVPYAELGDLEFEEVNAKERHGPPRATWGRGNGEEFAAGDRPDGLPYVVGGNRLVIWRRLLADSGWFPAERVPHWVVIQKSYPYPADGSDPLSPVILEAEKKTLSPQYTDDCEYRYLFNVDEMFPINRDLLIPDCIGPYLLTKTGLAPAFFAQCFDDIVITVTMSPRSKEAQRDTGLRVLDFVRYLLTPK